MHSCPDIISKTIGSCNDKCWCYRANYMFHFQGFTTQHLLVYKAVINCDFTSASSPTPCPLSHSFHHISQAVHLLSFLWRSPKAASFKLRTSITSSNMSFPLVVPLHWFNSQQFPWSQLDAWRLRAGQYQPCHRKGICSEAFSFSHQLFLQIGSNLTYTIGNSIPST